MTQALFVGIDIGTSGVRALAIDAAGIVRGQAVRAMPAPLKEGQAVSQDADVWWQAVSAALAGLLDAIPASAVRAIAVDGTSGTLLLSDANGVPLTLGLMYNDARAEAEALHVDQVAPADSAAHGSSSPLARLMHLQPQVPKARHVLHQADWIAGRLSGRYGFSDENNALKLGYDPILRRWPDWLTRLDVRTELLPKVLAPGESMGRIDPDMASAFGLDLGVEIIAGTTDGVAAFLATGAHEIGDAVTSLGTTLVVKVLSDRPLFAAEYGVYSHRIGDLWLPGGASNSGGAALLAFFDAETMGEMTPRLDPDRPTGLHYYPLPDVGERFPINDPHMQPRLDPRPADDITFFQGLLEGVADVERQAYRRMQSLGAPYPNSVRSVGGGAGNRAWARIRERALGVPMVKPINSEAAYGTALLARQGVRLA